MVTAQLHGGLGNQLFQIAAALAAGYRNQALVAFDFDGHLAYTQGHPPLAYRDNLFRRLASGKQELTTPRFVESRTCFQLPPRQNSLRLYGHFNCRGYFEGAEDFVRQSLELDPSILDQIRLKYSLKAQPACGVHVRRGDYLDKPPAGLYGLSDDYFMAAIAKLPKNTLLVVCSDDLAYCKTLFAGFNCIFSQETTDVGDFYLLAACDRQIISNSTFSWWASYLSPSLVPAMAPRQWLKQQSAQSIPVQQTPHLELI